MTGSASQIAVGEISASGEAEINGARVVTGGAVFSGDRIDTERGSIASLSLTSGRQIVLVEGGSIRVALAGSVVTGTLSHGEVSVLSSVTDPTVIEAGGTRVVPGKGGGVYAVKLDKNNLNVTASRGTVLVEAADRTVEVPEGKTLEATLGGVPQRGSVPSAAGSTSHLVTVLIVAAVALAAATTALLVIDLRTGCKVASPTTVGQCSVTH